VDELLKITTMDRMLLYHVKEWEVLIDWKFPACSKKAGTYISQSLTILDLKGVVCCSSLHFLCALEILMFCAGDAEPPPPSS
jgi:hypothetical protein